ncbi:MAG: TldD/PmbA family protein [Syntrophomonadaceae bacterium]|nr:TldD/PmbA family protein [Syntrophomonadaceae bacterium]
MEDFLRNTGEKALELARKRGVEAEAFLLQGRELSIEVIDGQVETLKEAEESGLGLRVINQGRLGFVFTSDLSDQAVKQVVEDAISISRYTEADPHNCLPRGKYDYPILEVYDPAIPAASLEAKIEMAREVERVARSSDSRISIVERAGYEDSEFTSIIMNTSGVYASGRGNFCGIYVFLVAEEDGDAQNGFSVMIKKRYNDLDSGFTGKEAAGNAVRALGARSISSAHLPCVMEPYVATRFLSLLAQMVDASMVQKGKSLFAGKLEQAVASPVVNLVDDATWTGGIGTFPFDGEGVPSRKNTIIKDGILTSYLYDCYSASKAGVAPSGNGQRGSFRSLPSVGTSNFILPGGSYGPQELYADMEKGLYITEVMGMHTANPISGDFSVGAAGIMIDNGKLTYPVRGATIAGNLGDFFLDIEALGNDLRFFGGKAAPSIRLKSLSIAGE